MQSITLSELRTTVTAGGISDVTLKGKGRVFVVEVETRSGKEAVLSKARSTQPRSFGNPGTALTVLRDVGITNVRVDATHWNPEEK